MTSMKVQVDSTSTGLSTDARWSAREKLRSDDSRTSREAWMTMNANGTRRPRPTQDGGEAGTMSLVRGHASVVRRLRIRDNGTMIAATSESNTTFPAVEEKQRRRLIRL